jgi:hypothetical protein
MKDVPWISSSFCTITSLRNQEFIDSLVDLLSAYKLTFAIDGFSLSQAERPRYKPLEHEPIRHCFLEDRKTLMKFGGNKGCLFDLTMLVDDDAGTVLKDTYCKSSFFIHINKDFFQSIDGTANEYHLREYLKFSADLYDLIKPLCGHTCDSIDDDAVHLSLDGGGLFRFMGFFSMKHGHVEHPHIDCPVSGISWANYFGPGCVRFWGQDKLINSTGAYQITELTDGGVLILTAPHPLTPDAPEHRSNQIALWKCLGLSPIPNLKRIAKYKSQDRWKGAPISLSMNGPWSKAK